MMITCWYRLACSLASMMSTVWLAGAGAVVMAPDESASGGWCLRVWLAGTRGSAPVGWVPPDHDLMSGAAEHNLLDQVRCSGMGRGLTRAYAGEDAQFTIESRDINRNKTTSGTKPFLVSIRGIISPQVSIQASWFRVTYLPTFLPPHLPCYQGSAAGTPL